MHWILTQLTVETLTKLLTAFKQCFVGFSHFWEKKGLLLGQNGYKCCLNTPNKSLTLLISQMHWILTHLTIETLTKLLTASKQYFVGFSIFWKEMGISVV
ncbi:hypothetical protein AtNW77_Chr00c001g0320311 [Arabidopsis thaliana]